MTQPADSMLATSTRELPRCADPDEEKPTLRSGARSSPPLWDVTGDEQDDTQPNVHPPDFFSEHPAGDPV